MKGPLILLVDDNPTGRKLAALQLTAAGYRVETAAGAREALEKARSLNLQAIISDVVMDDIDGFRFCQQLRSNQALAKVPVVLVSSHVDGAAERRLARECGASELVLRTPDFSAELSALEASFARAPPAKSLSDAELDADHLSANAHQLVMLAERARRAEQRYRALFECSSDVLAIIDRDGTIIEVNRRASSLLDAPPEAMVGRSIRSFAPAGQQQLNEAAWEQSLVTPGQATVVPVLRPDGRTIMIEFSTTLIELDGEQVGFCSGREVTERVRAAEALAKAEASHRTLIENIPDLIWRCREDLSIDYLSPNAARFMGQASTDRAAQPGLNAHPDDAARIASAWTALVTTGQHFDLEYRRQRKDGSWQWVRNRSYAITERNGERLYEGMMTDLSEKRAMEDALRQSQKMDALGQLTGGIAHDFNNMITAVLINADCLLDGPQLDEDTRAVATEIKQAALRASRLTRQLLAFSRRKPLDPQPVALNATIADMEKMLARLAGPQVTWTFAPGADAGRVRADTGQLEQVVMNLVVNARDAMPNGGALTVSTTAVTLGRDEAALLTVPPGRYARVSVTDTGTGIDEATLRRMFEPFFTTKPADKGTGLGLSTCYAIAKQSGGCMDVQTELGKGSSFRLYLPQLD